MKILLITVLLAIVVYLLVRQKPKTGGAKGRQFVAQVHGINHKNDDGSSRQEIIKRCREGEELILVPEPTNKYDHDAVKICRKNGEQLGYWEGNGRMGRDLAAGWTYRVTIDEIYPFQENRRKHGVRLRVEVLTMSRVTEAKKI